MAKNSNSVTDEKYYSYILINKSRKAGFYLIFSISLVMITLTITEASMQQLDWRSLLAPIILYCMPLFLIPPLEEWIYEAWQTKAQKYERHYKG